MNTKDRDSDRIDTKDYNSNNVKAMNICVKNGSCLLLSVFDPPPYLCGLRQILKIH